MKKILGLIIGIMFLSCAPTKTLITCPVKGDMMVKTMDGNYSIAQFDSMCMSDTLPKDFTKWENVVLKDYETNKVFILYLYLKESDMSESVYKVEKICSDSVKIIKRVIVE